MWMPIFCSSSSAMVRIRLASRKSPLRISLPMKKFRHTDISGASARSW